MRTRRWGQIKPSRSNRNRRQVGPLRAVLPEPAQTVIPTRLGTVRFESPCASEGSL
jgi:hypothetical protein